MRVKASPALEPNGLEPPTPPNAPARPPPLPRWISTSPIRNSPVRITNRFRMFASHIASAPPRSLEESAVNSKYTASQGRRTGRFPPPVRADAFQLHCSRGWRVFGAVQPDAMKRIG